MQIEMVRYWLNEIKMDMQEKLVEFSLGSEYECLQIKKIIKNRSFNL